MDKAAPGNKQVRKAYDAPSGENTLEDEAPPMGPKPQVLGAVTGGSLAKGKVPRVSDASNDDTLLRSGPRRKSVELLQLSGRKMAPNTVMPQGQRGLLE